MLGTVSGLILRESGDWNRRVSGKLGLGSESSSTTKTNLAHDLLGEFLGCYKPTPLKMNLVLEIRLIPKQVGKFLLQGVFAFPCRFFYSVSAPLDSAYPYFRVSGPSGDSVENLDWYFLIS